MSAIESTNIPLCVTRQSDALILYQLESDNGQQQLIRYDSTDGEKFIRHKKICQLIAASGRIVPSLPIVSMHVTIEKGLFQAIIGYDNFLFFATSMDGIDWHAQEKSIPKARNQAFIVPDYSFQQKHLAYWASETIHAGFSEDLISWQMFDDPLFDPHLMDNQSLQLLGCFMGGEEIFVPFAVKTMIDGVDLYTLSVAVFNKEDPRRIAWRLNYPFWSPDDAWIDTQSKPVGVVWYKGSLHSYWYTPGKGITQITHALFQAFRDDSNIHAQKPYIKLKKIPQNPILSPDASKDWKSRAVFNPAALFDKGNVHLLYRAVGENWVSSLGYAVSSDGIHMDELSAVPAYMPREPFEGVSIIADPNSPFASGPGWGGCEDPRMTLIDDRVYLTYVAFNGVTGPRIAMSSIARDEFHAQQWDQWSKPVLISKPDVIDKSPCIFPEKINGKYVVMHRVFPYILIDFLDSLEELDGNNFLKGEYKIAPSKHGWDSRKVGAGAPPIKTKDGWLLLYHAVDDKHDSQYQIGAMLLDLFDPTKVLFRTSRPILTPDSWFENDGHKAGVVYPCGAVQKGNDLLLYYGGADTYVCAATAPMDAFLDQLTTQEKVTMKMVQLL